MTRPLIVQILRAPIGGIRKHVFDIITSLEHENVDQVFITNTTDSDVSIEEISKIKNLKIYHLPIIDRPGFSDVLNLISIYRILARIHPTIVHGHGAKGGLYARLLSNLHGGKAYYTPHGGSLHRVYGKLKNKIYDFVEKRLIPLTDLYIFESNYSADTFRENIGVNINYVVNYNGVFEFNYPKIERYTKGTKLRLSSFGLLRNLKGHDIAILALSFLKKKNIPFHYTIFGTGESKEELLELISKYDLNDSITIKTYALNAPKEMCQFHFILHPSRFESFGYVPAEAMIQKIPVITSNVGGLAEVVDDSCGFISKKNIASEYAEILEHLYSGSITNLDQIIESGYQKVKKNFSLEKMLITLKKLYGIKN